MYMVAVSQGYVYNTISQFVLQNTVVNDPISFNYLTVILDGYPLPNYPAAVGVEGGPSFTGRLRAARRWA